jgi:hypothetical protein
MYEHEKKIIALFGFLQKFERAGYDAGGTGADLPENACADSVFSTRTPDSSRRHRSFCLDDGYDAVCQSPYHAADSACTGTAFSCPADSLY